MMYLLIFIIKIIDNIIQTLKSIATYRNKKILSSLLVIISQLMFYIIIKQVISDNTMLTIFIVSIASGIGNFVAFIIADYFKADDKWTYFMTSSDVEDVERLCNYLVEHNIKYLANYGINRKGQDTINIIAYSKTKDQSRLIESYLKNTTSKYLKEINR